MKRCQPPTPNSLLPIVNRSAQKARSTAFCTWSWRCVHFAADTSAVPLLVRGHQDMSNKLYIILYVIRIILYVIRIILYVIRIIHSCTCILKLTVASYNLASIENKKKKRDLKRVNALLFVYTCSATTNACT